MAISLKIKQSTIRWFKSQTKSYFATKMCFYFGSKSKALQWNQIDNKIWPTMSKLACKSAPFHCGNSTGSKFESQFLSCHEEF